MKKNPQLVEVEWIDSAFNAGWFKRTTYSTVAQCRMVGYLTHKSRKVVNVSMNLSPDDRGETMAIPRSCVRKIRKVR